MVAKKCMQDERRQSLLIHCIFEGSAGLEAYRTACVDLNGLTGHGVAALPCRALADIEAAEANDLNLFSLFELVDDDIKHSVDRKIGILTGEMALVCKRIDKLGFIH